MQLAFIKILRPKNLIIVAITQSFFYFLLIAPILGVENRQLTLFSFALFVVCTISLTAAGNVINDILDQTADTINKPEQTYIGQAISKKQSWVYYWTIVILGLGFAVYIGVSIQKWYLILIYPMVTTLLYGYSKYLKYRPFWGNFTVAFLCGFVVWILFLCEPYLLEFHNFKVSYASCILLGFGVFSMLGNFTREIIKDMEDLEGDKQMGAKTLPVIYGISKSKVLAYVISCILILALLYWNVKFSEMLDFRSKIYASLFLIGPIALSLYQIYKATEKKHFTKLSKFYKYILISGLLYAYIVIQNLIYA